MPSEPRALTEPPGQHFFGYYDRCPWNASNDELLAQRVDFDGRDPETDDVAQIVRVDAETGETTVVDETTAWNFQQGSMPQWVGPDHERRVIHNARDPEVSEGPAGEFVARIHDLESGETRTIPYPIYRLGPDGEVGYSLDFSRLYHARQGYGYAYPDPPAEIPDVPENDGVFQVDLATGEGELILSYDELVASLDGVPGDATHWLNHVQTAPGGDRFSVLHRWWSDEFEGRWHEQLVAVEADGSSWEVVADHGIISHYDWRTPTELVAWTSEPDTGTAFHYYDLDAGTVEPVAPDLLTEDGHNSFSPDGRWMLTDTYADANQQQNLVIYDVETGDLHDVTSLFTPDLENRDVRCDLHPRWDRTGGRVCVDSLHTGERQMYVIDVSDVTGVDAE